MIIMSVTTEIGANTAAIIQRLLGGFLTTAEKKQTRFYRWFTGSPLLPKHTETFITPTLSDTAQLNLIHSKPDSAVVGNNL